MGTIDRLISLFSKFPGIGLRQARRFVFFLLTTKGDFLSELVSLLSSLKTAVRECESCYRFFEARTQEKICSICAENNNKALLIVAEKDIDVENIHKSGAHTGAYFVLGGLLSPLSKDKSVRTEELIARVKKDIEQNILKEIIIALSAHPYGDYTALHIKKILEAVIKKHEVKITTLGRGISTGTEIEYSDAETIKHALDSRR